jgi:8-oxo-dGTP diphosphatase
LIHVVAGAVTDAAGRVLIAQRPPGKHLAGGWEFPGGKLEPGETRVAGLARELREELGISIGAPRPLLRLRHTYTFGEVLIDMWVVARYAGEPRGLDGQALRWCSLDELGTVELLPADAPIVRALRLPEQLTAADSPYYQVLDYSLDRPVLPVELPGEPNGSCRLVGVRCSTVAEALTVGRHTAPDFIIMRCEAPADDLRSLCESVTQPVFVRGMELKAAWSLGASGVSSLPA